MEKSSTKNKLSNLKDDINNLFEIKRIDIVSKEILNKYKTLNEIKENMNDPLIIEFKSLLKDLNDLSNYIENQIINGLKI